MDDVRRIATVLAISLMGFGAAGAVDASARSVPQGFFGVDMDPWTLMRNGHDINYELSTAAASGVESVRIPLYWFDVQPYSSIERVPAGTLPAMTPAPDGGAPSRWGNLDTFVTAAANRGIRILPIIIGAPQWAADTRWDKTLKIPSDPATYARFSAALVNRYGSNGTFWTSNPSITKTPITTWQIWNEPDIDRYWPQHLGETQTVSVNGRVKRVKGLNFAPTYTVLLRAARAAIKQADPSAQVMLASMTNKAWYSLKLLYASGARGNFDEVGANVFSKTPANLITAIKEIRSTMAANGDSRLPYSATEYSWSSSVGAIPLTAHMGWLVTSVTNQAKNAGAAMDLFIRYRSTLKLKGTYWYTWASDDSGTDSVWDYAGMRKVGVSSVSSKPVLATFAKKALAAEGCARKAVATSCAP